MCTILCSARQPVQLQSSSSDLVFAPNVNTNIVTRAVSVSTLWNVLPSSSVKLVENTARFRHHLKTYLYNPAYFSLAYQFIC